MYLFLNVAMESYISLLNEYRQRTQVSLEYEEGSTDGPSHNKTFTMRAIVDGQRYPEGTGKTKKEAKQNAAKNALNGIKSTPITGNTSSPVQSVCSDKTISHPNYTCWLNEHAQKNRLELKARESTKMDPTNITHICKYFCGGREFPEAYGKTKKEAKEAAALHVYEELHKTQNTEVFDDSNRAQRSEATPRRASLDRSSAADDSRSSTPDHNYIAFLNNFCQKQKCVFDFRLVEKRGPPHNPEFVYKVVMKGKEYPEGQGKSSKEAKQNAAQQAWFEIRDQQSWTTQSSEDDTSSQTQETCSSEDVRCSSNIAPGTPSSSESVLFRDSSAVSSPMAISPCMSPMDVKPKIKLAPNFNLSPNGLAWSKEEGPNMNVRNQSKQPGGQTLNHSTKSRFLEDFDSISPIGKGGFGRVFKARRKLEDKFFAVKIVKNKDKARREVAALALFNNANIVRYYTCWVEDMPYKHDTSESFSDSGSGPGTQFLYIQMEFCEGNTLRAWIEERNSSSERFPDRRIEAAQISRQVLKAVDYIHSKERIHRDLKPANILFSSGGTVKVGDFGLVTAAEKENDDRLMERTKKTGTRSYMSPEQETETSYDKKVDIYALGLIYFELIWNLLTVHERKKIWDDVRRRLFPPQFSETYKFEHKLIYGMLNPKPEDRPDATDLIRELNQNDAILKTQNDSGTL